MCSYKLHITCMCVTVLLNCVFKYVCCTYVEMCAYILNVHVCTCMCLPAIVKFHLCVVHVLKCALVHLFNLSMPCVYLFKCVCINFYLSLYKYTYHILCEYMCVRVNVVVSVSMCSAIA